MITAKPHHIAAISLKTNGFSPSSGGAPVVMKYTVAGSAPNALIHAVRENALGTRIDRPTSVYVMARSTVNPTPRLTVALKPRSAYTAHITRVKPASRISTVPRLMALPRQRHHIVNARTSALTWTSS